MSEDIYVHQLYDSITKYITYLKQQTSQNASSQRSFKHPPLMINKFTKLGLKPPQNHEELQIYHQNLINEFRATNCYLDQHDNTKHLQAESPSPPIPKIYENQQSKSYNNSLSVFGNTSSVNVANSVSGRKNGSKETKDEVLREIEDMVNNSQYSMNIMHLMRKCQTNTGQRKSSQNCQNSSSQKNNTQNNNRSNVNNNNGNNGNKRNDDDDEEEEEENKNEFELKKSLSLDMMDIVDDIDTKFTSKIVCSKDDEVLYLVADRQDENIMSIKATGIHLDKNNIRCQHQLVAPSHDCHCLDGFKSDIDELHIGNPDDHRNRAKDCKKRNDILKIEILQQKIQILQQIISQYEQANRSSVHSMITCNTPSPYTSSYTPSYTFSTTSPQSARSISSNNGCNTTFSEVIAAESNAVSRLSSTPITTSQPINYNPYISPIPKFTPPPNNKCNQPHKSDNNNNEDNNNNNDNNGSHTHNNNGGSNGGSNNNTGNNGNGGNNNNNPKQINNFPYQCTNEECIKFKLEQQKKIQTQQDMIKMNHSSIKELLIMLQTERDMKCDISQSQSSNHQKNKKKNKKKQNKSKQKNIFYEIENKASYDPLPSRRARNNINISKTMTTEIVPSKVESKDAMPNWYKYMEKSIAMQFNDYAVDINNIDNTMMAIDYDFCEEKDENLSYYCIIERVEKQDMESKKNNKWKWKMYDKLFTRKEVEELDNKIKIPESSRKKLASQLNEQHAVKIIDFITELLSQKEMPIEWWNPSAFGRKSGKQRIVLRLENQYMHKIMCQLAMDLRSTELPPIIMFNNDSHWVEWVWKVRIIENVDIGISFKMSADGTVEMTGIHTDKQYLMEQHALVDPKHNIQCKCFDDWISYITDIEICGDLDSDDNKCKNFKQRYESFKSFVYRFIDASPTDNYQSLKQEALLLLQINNISIKNVQSSPISSSSGYSSPLISESPSNISSVSIYHSSSSM